MKTKSVFTGSFNLEQCSGALYTKMIEGLRVGVSNKIHNNSTYTLIPQQTEATSFFNVILFTKNGEATFRFRADDLYLVGYCVGAAEETYCNREPGDDKRKWYELQNEKMVHLIEGSEFIPIGHSYGGLRSAAGRNKLEGLKVNRSSIEAAFNKFLKLQPKDHERIAHIMLQVVFVISEAMRFHSICKDISDNFNNMNCEVTGKHNTLIHQWNHIGQAIKGIDNSPGAPNPIGEMLGMSLAEARACLAVMKG